LTFDDLRKPTGRGGWRPGAGRPRGRKQVAHERRDAFADRHPQHVTWRVRPLVPSLRRRQALEIVRRAIVAGGHRPDFRVVHFNLLSNHLHFIVEAASTERLARGMQGLAGRMVRRLNRLLRRNGKLLAERYHARTLQTPAEVRSALAYVLLNQKHHRADRGERVGWSSPDPFSSAAWFDGWRETFQPREPWQRELMARPRPTAEATVWLLTTGWRRHGLISFKEVPGRPKSRPSPGSSGARRAGRTPGQV
jgi:REP-associated tyrosine transposase